MYWSGFACMKAGRLGVTEDGCGTNRFFQYIALQFDGGLSSVLHNADRSLVGTMFIYHGHTAQLRYKGKSFHPIQGTHFHTLFRARRYIVGCSNAIVLNW
jgi:hypothetical protein